MTPAGRSHAVFRSLLLFALGYVGVITLLTVANNGWYPILTAGFCGSLSDFTDGPVPAVCLSFWGYWARAAIHGPYAVAAGILSAAVVGGYRRWSS